MGKLGKLIYELSKRNSTVNNFIVKRIKTKTNTSGSLDEVAKAGLVMRTKKMMTLKINGTRRRIEKECDDLRALEEFEKLTDKIVKLLTVKIEKSISTEEEFYNFKLLFTALWKHVDLDVCSSVYFLKYDTNKLKKKIDSQDFTKPEMYLFDSDNLKELDEIFKFEW